MIISLADVGVDPADDAGRTWHPRPDKTDARDANGNLRDLTDREVEDHCAKPEADEQPDGRRRRARERRPALAAEDSIETDPEEV